MEYTVSLVFATFLGKKNVSNMRKIYLRKIVLIFRKKVSLVVFFVFKFCRITILTSFFIF